MKWNDDKSRVFAIFGRHEIDRKLYRVAIIRIASSVEFENVRDCDLYRIVANA